VTWDLVRAGQILKIEVLDHVIMGQGNFSSLKSLGYLYARCHDHIDFAWQPFTETFSKSFSGTFSRGIRKG
jgi:hypothetical protein